MNTMRKYLQINIFLEEMNLLSPRSQREQRSYIVSVSQRIEQWQQVQQAAVVAILAEPAIDGDCVSFVQGVGNRRVVDDDGARRIKTKPGELLYKISLAQNARLAEQPLLAVASRIEPINDGIRVLP
jgi:hypothetical protein